MPGIDRLKFWRRSLRRVRAIGQIGLRETLIRQKPVAISHYYRTVKSGQQWLMWVNIALCRLS